jgi:hypothetical protein
VQSRQEFKRISAASHQEFLVVEFYYRHETPVAER